jgi:hypothetical protein
MRECKIVVLASVCIFINSIFGSAGTAFAEESTEKEISIGFNADFLSQYVWRGQRLNKDWVFQPSVDIGYESLSATIWGNMDLSSQNDQSGEFSEIDYTLEQSDAVPAIGGLEFEGLYYSLGAIHYDPHGNECSDLTEVFWGFGLDDGILNPSIQLYHDTDKIQRTYALFSIGHSFEKIFEISEMPVGMETGASIGWGSRHYNSYYWETNSSGENDLNLAISFPIELPDEWSFTPAVTYTHLLEKEIRESDAYSTKSDLLVVGLSLSKSF